MSGWSRAKITAVLYPFGAGAMALNVFFASLIGASLGLRVLTPVQSLLGGAVLTETIFSWPGIGKWLIDAIGRRDYPVVQAGILISALIFISVNLVVDLLYGVVNPRMRGGPGNPSA